MQKPVATYRLKESAIKKVEEMAFVLNMSKATVLENLIDDAYDKMQGNPKLKEALVKLQQINDMLVELGTELKQ